MQQPQFESRSTLFIPVPPAAAWRALTEPEQIRQYMFGAEVETSGVVGGPISYRYEWGGKPFVDRGTIVALEPGKALRMTVARETDSGEAVPDGFNTLAFEVAPADGGCEVSVLQGNNPSAELAERSRQNWDAVLGELTRFLTQRAGD